jgi:hypothetical protein
MSALENAIVRLARSKSADEVGARDRAPFVWAALLLRGSSIAANLIDRVIGNGDEIPEEKLEELDAMAGVIVVEDGKAPIVHYYDTKSALDRAWREIKADLNQRGEHKLIYTVAGKGQPEMEAFGSEGAAVDRFQQLIDQGVNVTAADVYFPDGREQSLIELDEGEAGEEYHPHGRQYPNGPAHYDYLIAPHHRGSGKFLLYSWDGWHDAGGPLVGLARGYNTVPEAFEAAQRHAVQRDTNDAIVLLGAATILARRTQIGNVGTSHPRGGSYNPNGRSTAALQPENFGNLSKGTQAALKKAARLGQAQLTAEQLGELDAVYQRRLPIVVPYGAAGLVQVAINREQLRAVIQ